MFVLLALPVALPLCLGIAAVVLVTMGRPVLYRQLRPGLNGEPFEILKFRTMTEASDNAGVLRSDADRMTTVGRFLRRASLDELPEMINILKGEMSLVGPRPLLLEYLPLYSVRQARRHEVRPGLTGWAQINGRNALTWEVRFDLDVWYVDNRSLGLDLVILYRTLVRVVRGDGVTQAGHATTQRFRGSVP